ncbi:hypothetical protein FHU37_003320 [Allostreptomyces psammosilenae]|uniref:Uncharacterized protein n=1 Tax=Allostreptomyces psammosilenae TaxID=1892865 RepID=A0A852ZXB9_9ACTN|nr:hypothetical protein [Allostreptomyces psammosilenae]
MTSGAAPRGGAPHDERRPGRPPTPARPPLRTEGTIAVTHPATTAHGENTTATAAPAPERGTSAARRRASARPASGTTPSHSPATVHLAASGRVDRDALAPSRHELVGVEGSRAPRAGSALSGALVPPGAG